MKLVYFSLFHNRKYMDLFRLLMLSIKLKVNCSDLEFLVLTSKELEYEVLSIGTLVGLKLKTHVLEADGMYEATAAKCRIFEADVSKYTHLLYLDVDILATGDFEPLFKIENDVLYGVTDGILSHPANGSVFFNSTVCQDPSKEQSINSGAFVFSNTPKMKTVMTECYQFMTTWKKYKQPDQFYDQPFINFFFYTQGCLNTEYLSKYGHLHKGTDPSAEYVFTHFLAPVGDPVSKYKRMSEFFTKLVKSTNHNSLFHKSYHWQFGYIFFKENLETTWGTGTYERLGDRTVRANFGGYNHYLTFDETFETFLSVRYEDGDVVSGSRIVLNY